MKAFVSGLVNIETTLKIKEFPLQYYPIDYPFFGIGSSVSGVAYNVAKAFRTLGDEVQIVSFAGEDAEGERIEKEIRAEGMDTAFLFRELAETPVTVAIYDTTGRRQIHCDLKDIQEKTMEKPEVEQKLAESDLAVICNINFNRPLLKKAKALGKRIATDVHVIADSEDEFNKEFMENADILFLSDEKIPCAPEKFLIELKEKYPAEVIVIGLGASGAICYDRKMDELCKLPAVQIGGIVSTIGAGDALFTSFLHYYEKGYKTVEALKRAEVFAALKIRQDGAAKGFCDENTVEEIYRSQWADIQILS